MSVLARLERWLAQHRPRYHRNLRPGASDAELEGLRQSLARDLPAELRALLSWHNGQGADFAGSLVESWLLMSAAEIAAAKKELDETAPSGWRKEWIPFLDDDAGNYVCLDSSEPNSPVREFWQGNADHPIVAQSLAQWLESLVAAVERGEYVEDPERGRFLRRT
jgi:cell wall assembly regulator SMI1